MAIDKSYPAPVIDGRQINAKTEIMCGTDEDLLQRAQIKSEVFTSGVHGSTTTVAFVVIKL